jgi:hypothetical protein
VVFGAYVFWLGLIICTAADRSVATGDVSVKSWGSILLICWERGGLRHPSILCTATQRLRRRLRSDRSVRTKGRTGAKLLYQFLNERKVKDELPITMRPSLPP